MAKTKISEYSSTSAGANLNTDINNIDIDEGCAPSGINNAIRTLMAQVKDFQTGVSGDGLTLGGALSGTSATFSGNVTASAISGASMTLSGDLTIADKIIHSGDTNTAIRFPSADTVTVETSGTERMRIDSSGNVGIGTSSPLASLDVRTSAGGTSLLLTDGTNSTLRIKHESPNNLLTYETTGAASQRWVLNSAERMRIDSSGNVLVGTTTSNPAITNGTGATLKPSGVVNVSRTTEPSFFINRKGNDGAIVLFYQDGSNEGSISVSGSTVSYNGGHISRWSQWQNQEGQPEIYRGTVLDSTDDMCEWHDNEGNLLLNEQATKTIISNTASSKKVAGVFDIYDLDDKDNPYDFYVAQSGDFVIRIAEGVTIENGDLLESAGDGTARPQSDDICRSSTIAKVTSNYVSTTYADGSFCVPCILMIG